MRQFATSNEAAFLELEERAKRACIRFRSQELPPGCEPDHADIGFEITQNPSAAKLYVQQGVQYSGTNRAIKRWLDSGVIQFSDFAFLKDWLRKTLAPAFCMNVANRRLSNNQQTSCNSAGETRQSASQLTDISAVHEGIQNIDKPLYMDEDALVEKLTRRVLGQDDAIKSLSAVMVRHCARTKPTRPAVVFAVGPSGVGKTRTAEVLSQELKEFDDDNHGYQYLRLDMTEYQEAHRVSQLIGAPQGYVGHGEGSQLVDALQANPRTIVLFDEIEKAHPSILRVLMNAMDAGRLSTSSRSPDGREIDCRFAVFMFTSNLDAKEILDELDSRNGFGNRAVEDDVCRRRLNAAGIAPEIVGRIGRFLVYRPLSPENRAEIVALAVAEVAEEYGVNVVYVEPTVIIDLMQKVRSQNFGVRPERYLIDDLLGGSFAKAAKDGLTEHVVVSGPPFNCRKNSEINEEISQQDTTQN